MEDRPASMPRDHLEGIFKGLRRSLRHTWVIGVILVLGSGAVFGLVRLRHPRFQSQAVMYYQEGIQWSLSGSDGGGRRLGARLREILLSRTRLQKLVEEYHLYGPLVAAGLMNDAIDEFRLAITFKQNEGDTFVISYMSESPDLAQNVTARLTDELIEENMRMRAEQAEFAKGFLDAEKKRNEDTLRAKELEVARFLAHHPEFAAEPQASAGGAAVRATTKKGAAVDPADTGDPVLTALRREEERLRHQLVSPGDTPKRVQDPALVAARSDAEARLAAARRDLNDKHARFTDQHPDVRAAEKLVKELELAVARATEALRAGDAAPPPGGEVVEIEPRAALQARLTQVEQEIRNYQAKKKGKEPAAPDEAAASNDAAQRIVAVEAEWARLNREVSEARDRFQQLDTRQFVASMAASSLTSGQAAQFTIIDPAFLPTRPIGTSRNRILAFGVMASLALGIALAGLLGILDDRVLDRRDVEALGLAPVLIEVPLARRRRRRD